MPYYGDETDYEKMIALAEETKRRIKDKYPTLIEGSNGWNRAYAAQRKKVRRA